MKSTICMRCSGLGSIEGDDGPCIDCAGLGVIDIDLPEAVYTKPVKFTKTGQYGCGPEDEDDVYTVEEFRKFVENRMLIDYDGSGHPVRDRKCDPKIDIYPSRVDEIPSDATHIVWYNR